ncbi:MAG: transposase [Caldilineaceae bacterium SB0662_bin_9]|uniref:Transposase n=1 Tax=Caldilineaceae bacterium SB0662_bin_9 TaxID=2605258 RepID=A0A6B1DT88_9CHLR|nr:transposase [Caldilineaceae bacterium SB0662_bin_9]
MDLTVSQAIGSAERDTVPELLSGVQERGYRPRTLGADRGYDTQDCVGKIRARRVTPHVARKKKHSTLDRRTTRHADAVSLRIRKRVEEVLDHLQGRAARAHAWRCWVEQPP